MKIGIINAGFSNITSVQNALNEIDIDSELINSNNPSYVTGSLGEMKYSTFINDPQTYITTVGMYNTNRELLAVAKLSQPLLKNKTKEVLIKVKLDF